jgi:hypothetical protein
MSKSTSALSTSDSDVDFQAYIKRTIDMADSPKNLDEVCTTIKTLMSDGRRVFLVHVWGIGRLISSIQEEEGRYGSHAVEKVAEKLGKTPRLFYDMLRFHREYPDVERVLKMKLDWTAARELMRIEDTKVREKLEQKAEDSDATVRDVREMVNEAKKNLDSKDPSKKKKSSKKARPIAWYKKVQKHLDRCLSDLLELMQDKAEMQVLVECPEATTDEEYKILIEGSGKTPPLIEEISKLGERMITALQREVVPMKEVFQNVDESSSSEEAEG